MKAFRSFAVLLKTILMGEQLPAPIPTIINTTPINALSLPTHVREARSRAISAQNTAA